MREIALWAKRIHIILQTTALVLALYKNWTEKEYLRESAFGKVRDVLNLSVSLAGLGWEVSFSYSVFLR